MANPYCTSADITACLPPSHGLSAAQLTESINTGSREVDAQLSHLYWPFPSHTAAQGQAGPVCPWPVRNAARYYGVAHALMLMSTAQGVGEQADATEWRKRASEAMEGLRDGTVQLPNETVTETLISTSWGDGDPFETDEAELEVSEMAIIPESAEISGYEYDIDFRLYFKRTCRAWVVQRIDDDIGSGVGTELDPGDDLTYECSFLKKREVIHPGLRTSRLIAS